MTGFEWIVSAVIAVQPTTIVEVDRDNVFISQSCTVVITAPYIEDADGNGVIQISGNDITVNLAGEHLRGAAPDASPDSYSGVGIRIGGTNVTVIRPKVSGFKVGIHAINTTGFMLDGADVSDNFRQRLGSTVHSEDSTDWLRPHENDDNEWSRNYGAGVLVEVAVEPTIRNVIARHTQNGIMLEGCVNGRIYDNDCSFLSGWGLAMWRSGGNMVSRNAFDFCVRGYSHGVYNRGQDSAGILMFEQCTRNLISENSCTHSGDGIFGFSGREALGETGIQRESDWYRFRGNTANLILDNDCSYNVAHGVEMTFAMGTWIRGNTLVGNAICGVWAGYCSHTRIFENIIESNGDMGYGDEGGGVNIEHGFGNWIVENTFRNNTVGVYLWWDEDTDLARLPWTQANDTRSANTQLLVNTFNGDDIAIKLRKTENTSGINNEMNDVGRVVDADAESLASLNLNKPGATGGRASAKEKPGQNQPIGQRDHLGGREAIIMTEWGPWDHESPLLRRLDDGTGAHEWEVRSSDSIEQVTIQGPVGPDGLQMSRVDGDDGTSRITVTNARESGLVAYRLVVGTADRTLRGEGVFMRADWNVVVFPWTNDPRENVQAWRAESRGDAAVSASITNLSLTYANGGASDLGVADSLTDAGLPTDRFGTIATTTVEVPAGRWTLRSRSDDGIRVWMDGDVVIDDWTWHAPRLHSHVFELSEARTIEFRVEHFELDGYATLNVSLTPADS